LLDQLQTWGIEKINEWLPLGGKDRTAISEGGKRRDIASEQVSPLCGNESSEIGAPLHSVPQMIKEAITFKCIA
jgi:hypothetical protein